MKQDAFDDLGLKSFNYEAQLRVAREALRRKIATYIRNYPQKTSRELSKEFGLSVGAISEIATKYIGARKVGRPLGRTVVFDVVTRRNGEKKVEQAAVTTKDRKVTVRMMRARLKACRGAERVSLAKLIRPAYGKWDYYELDNSVRTQTTVKAASAIETGIRTMANCVESGKRSESGENAYTYIKKWMAEHRQSKHFKWAKQVSQRYEALRRS